MSHNAVRSIVAAAPEITTRDAWSEPDMRVIEDDRAPPPRLEDDALPAGWDAWITNEAEARACPRDYIAAALIGAASAWIGNSRRVAATADWNEPVHLWMALIGAPSAGKTPALAPLIEASRAIEREEEPAWREALARYERDAEAARATDKAWRDDVHAAVADEVAPPDRPATADAPESPARPRIVMMDVTTEELLRRLAENPRGLLQVRDELAGWLGAHDRYGGRGADRAFALETWNGGAYVCDRVRHHDTPVRIERASLAVLGGMVPDRLRDALADADDGLAARIIYVWPDPAPIAPLADRGDADTSQRREMLMVAARRLRGLPMDADQQGTPVPRALRLARDAVLLFDRVRRDAMERARTGHGLAAGWTGKNPGRSLRLAGVYELLAWAARGDGAPEPTSISADAVARVGEYLDYAAAMFGRVTAGIAISQAEADAATIARYLLASRRGRLNERELYQSTGYAWARAASRRAEALAVLDRAGWIRRSIDGVGRGRPAGNWDVSPRVQGA